MNRTLTYKIFDLNRNLENMGAPPKAEKPRREKSVPKRSERSFSATESAEIICTSIPSWEMADVRKIEGMLKGYCQAAASVLARRPYSPELAYEGGLEFSLGLCQKELSQLAELKKLSDAILKKTERSRFLESHFESELCKLIDLKTQIQDRSRSTNLLQRLLRDELVAEEDLHPDPTLDPRNWRAKGTRIKETGELHDKFVAIGKESLFCPGSGKRLASHRKTERRLSNNWNRKLSERQRLEQLGV